MEDLSKGNWHDPDRVKHFAETYSQRYGIDFWESLLKLVDSAKRSTIADFGCGPGLWLDDAGKRFNAKHLHGLDASEEMLAFAERILKESHEPREFTLHHIDFDSDDIPIEENTLDLAFVGYAFHEVRSPDDFAKKIHSCINANGTIAVLDFVSGNPKEFVKTMMKTGMSEERANRRYPHMCKHSIEDIQRILELAGFNSIESTHLDSVRAIVVGVKRVNATQSSE